MANPLQHQLFFPLCQQLSASNLEKFQLPPDFIAEHPYCSSFFQIRKTNKSSKQQGQHYQEYLMLNVLGFLLLKGMIENDKVQGIDLEYLRNANFQPEFIEYLTFAQRSNQYQEKIHRLLYLWQQDGCNFSNFIYHYLQQKWFSSINREADQQKIYNLGNLKEVVDSETLKLLLDYFKISFDVFKVSKENDEYILEQNRFMVNNQKCLPQFTLLILNDENLFVIGSLQHNVQQEQENQRKQKEQSNLCYNQIRKIPNIQCLLKALRSFQDFKQSTNNNQIQYLKKFLNQKQEKIKTKRQPTILPDTDNNKGQKQPEKKIIENYLPSSNAALFLSQNFQDIFEQIKKNEKIQKENQLISVKEEDEKEDEKEEEYKQPQQQQINKNFMKNFKTIVNNQNTECEICCVNIKVSDQTILNCKHKIHFECLKTECSTKYQNGERLFCDYKCFVPNCRNEIGIKILKKCLTSKQIYEIQKSEIEKNSNIHCPYENCNQPFQVVKTSEFLEKQIKMDCQYCKQPICNLCSEKFHGQNPEGQQCPSIQTNILKGLQGQAKCLCPFCKTISLKDESCNHVTCQKCRKDLCFVCSVDRRPIIGHDNSFHRVGCTDYASDPTNTKGEAFNERACKKCAEDKVPCKYPISLEQYKKENEWAFK